MNRKSFYILFVCVWTVFAVRAQTYNIRERAGYNALVLNNIGIANGTILISGAKAVNYSPYPIVPYFFHLQQIANNHFLEFYEFPGDSTISYFPYWSSMTNMKNGGLVVVGGRNFDEPKGDPFLTRIDHTDSVPKTFFFADSSLLVNYIVGVCQSNDSSFFLLSVAQKSNSPKFFASVVKSTFDGQKKWSKSFPVPIKKNYYPNLIRSFKSDIVFAGIISDSSSQSFTSFSPQLTFIDTAGNIQKEWVLEQDIQGVKGMVVNEQDSSIVFCSNKFVSNNPAPKYHPYLSKVDGNGNVKWVKLIGVPFYESPLQSLIKLKDKNYITVGTAPDDFNDNGISQPYMAGWVVKFTDMVDSAHVLWERKYRGALSGHSTNILHDIVEKTNGSLVTVGESTQSDSLYPQQGWVLGLDSFGCLVPGCENWTALKETNEHANPLLRLYPNPMQSFLYFDVQGVATTRSFTLMIMDINGKTMLTTMVMPQVQYSLPTEDYAKGSYIFTLTEKGKVVEKRKVEKL